MINQDKDKNDIDHLKDYIAKGIKDYRWSDEFLVKDLARQGIAEYNARLLIEKVKKERGVSNRDSIFGDDDAAEKGVTGWLAFFCYAIGIGELVSFVYPLIQYLDSEYNRGPYDFVDLISGGLFLLIAAYGILQLIRRKPNAVFICKAYVMLAFASNLIGLLLFEASDADAFYNMPRLVRSLIWAIIWFTYLSLSKQVKAIIPKEKRKVCALDWMIVLSPILVYVVLMLVVMGKMVGGPISSQKATRRELIGYIDSQTFPIVLSNGDKVDSARYDTGTGVITTWVSSSVEPENISPKTQEILKSIPRLFKGVYLDVFCFSMNDSRMMEYCVAGEVPLHYIYQLSDGRLLFEHIVDEDFYEITEESFDSNTYSASNLRYSFNFLNSLCPIQIDEVTTMLGATFGMTDAVLTYRIAYRKEELDMPKVKPILIAHADELSEDYLSSCRAACLNLKIVYKDIAGNVIYNTH